MRFSVSIADPAPAVEPGAFVRTEVVIRNESDVAGRAHVHVAGPAAPWSWIVPAEVDVAPGSQAVVALGFRVPRASEPPAGIMTFEVVVAGAGNRSPGSERIGAAEAAEVRVAGALTVAAFVDVAVQVDPPWTGASPPVGRHVVVENRGNVAATTTLRASSEDGRLEVTLASGVVETAVGGRTIVPVSLRAGRRPLLEGRTLPFSVSATPDGGEALTVWAAISQPARLTRKAALIACALAVLVLAAGLRLIVLAPDGKESTAVVAAGTSDTSPGPPPIDENPDCPATGHVDPMPIGTVRDVATLPAHYSFFHVAADGCSPARWNPCEPIHYVINPANAPPTGVADTKEAFRRLGKATGMTYVDDGVTDEAIGGPGRAYQPARYGERWAPILVHWLGTDPGPGGRQRAGGGAPTRVGDVYVSGELLLSPSVETDEVTHTTIGGGFVDRLTIGRIGPDGVTWGRVILHELGHITGLGHVSEPSQLMYPDASEQTGTSDFQRWDLAGLQFLGKEAGCLQTPPPAPGT